LVVGSRKAVEIMAETTARTGPRPRRVVLIVLVALGASVLLGVGVAWRVAQSVHLLYAGSSSMEPTYPQGSRLVVRRTDGSESKVGDVVTFLAPGRPDLVVFKRVLAVGPATVTLVDGKVVVDGQAVDEPYLAAGTRTEAMPVGSTCSGSGPCTVAAGELYVLGDNRGDSEDSRVFGPLRRDAITGVVTGGVGG
jgi:signal peptidase I